MLKIVQKLSICLLTVMLASSTVNGQTAQPTWWFGVSGAANLNFYSGTTQRLNNSLIVPTAFHKGFGVRPFGSVFLEYRPASAFGAMLNVGYDGRGAKFDGVIAPCDCPATLETNLSYVTVEPSLRLSLPSSNFFLFAGPRIAFNMEKDFNYTQLRQPNTDAELSAIRKTVFSGQVGMGYDFPISSANSGTKVSISPFVSYHPYFGQDPRDIESLSITTIRTGIALKFGKAKKAAVVESPIVVVPVREVLFSVTEPKTISVNRQVSETLPLRNSVFFDEGSVEIPSRYIVLTKDQASGFREEGLQKVESETSTSRSARQLVVYYNILNILGDRLRSNPGSSISLSGASAKGPKEGKVFAESVKQYIVTVFGIDGSRITTQGRTKPLIPSEQPGATKELVALRAEDRRVDFLSSSPELLMEVGGGIMKPVQIIATEVNPLEDKVILNVDGANELLKTWSVNITDEQGNVKTFGPYTKDQESISGNAILGNSPEGNFKLSMVGETKTGLPVTKESSIRLVRPDETIKKAFRYSILFDFDRAKTIASYEKFLKDVVVPLITDGSTVVIKGHTDIIGGTEYNYKLSHNRAMQTQKIIESALSNSNKNNVKFETVGFGEDLTYAPFENNFPEKYFYNRTVIIEIIPEK